MNSQETDIVGVVQDGRFQPLQPNVSEIGLIKLTSITMSAAQSPESAVLDLAPYEGGVIMVRGHHSDGWIYSAQVIEQAGPILAAVAKQAFGYSREEYSY